MKNPNLPEELLIEIFSALPAKSVGRCRCLSKLWRTNLSTSQFVKLHLSRIKTDQKDDASVLVTNSGSLRTIRIPVDGTDDVISRELDLPTYIFRDVVDSCNGLVLVEGQAEELFVVNPVTLQHVRIENTPILVERVPEEYIMYRYGFGFDNCSDDYKIVKFFCRGNIDHERIETLVHVYSLKNGVWRSANSSPYNHNVDSIGTHGAFVNGSIHWLALDEDDWYVVAAFDVASEMFRGIPVPNDKLDQSLGYSVYAAADCLVMLDTDCQDPLDMWIMKEYGQVNSWTKFSLINPYDVHQMYFLFLVIPIGFIRENEFVLLTSAGNFLVWNLIEGTQSIFCTGAGRYRYEGRMFVSSLVSPIQSDIAS